MCHGPDVKSVGFPTGFTSCPDGLAASLQMPSCWNGEDFNPSNPSAHMAYPSNKDGMAACSAPYNVARFPTIFIEYWLNVETFNGLYEKTNNPWVLSMGDPTGYGFHADFVSVSAVRYSHLPRTNDW